MSNDDISTILREYDKESQTQIDGIRSNVESVIEEMKAALDLSLLSIPPSVRRMSMRTLIKEYGGCIDKAAAALAPSTPKKRTPKKTTGTPLQSYQTASLSDLLAKKGQQMEMQRRTPTRATPTRGTPTRGRLPPKIPTPNKLRTPTKSPRMVK